MNEHLLRMHSSSGHPRFGCGRKKSIGLNQNGLYLITLLFLRGGGEKLALCEMYVCSTWSSTAQTISVWHQSTARAIRKHAVRLFSVALAVLRCRTTIVLRAQMTSYTFQAGARKQSHDWGRGSNLFQNYLCTVTFWIPAAGKTWLNMTETVCSRAVTVDQLPPVPRCCVYLYI